MKSKIIVKRYTQGLVNSIKSEAEFSAISQELSNFALLLNKHEKLKDTLLSPFLPTSKKTQIAEEVLSKQALGEKASRLISLLVENNRLGLFPDIIESLPEVWNEQRGTYTYEVASVVPLTDDQRKKLEKKLESLERRPVILKYRIDPELVGGLCVRRENIVYDVSIKGNLMKLREEISEG
ncbi:MAG: ATP synthase F1 subunit delta [Candidatus Aminicenantes bacterium]|nr:ATP synthase F1 subunit delta [Candidatus Aminicenantes bacterium]